jgi:hypothetical protein
MKNYEMKIEQHERYYRVIFTPDTNYGNISTIVYSRKEAYAKYHEIKNIVYNTRPGRLTAFEYLLTETGHYKENYLCSCRTGKSVDTIAIFNNIDKELQQISQIYNNNKIEQAKENYSKQELNIIHGIEFVDMSYLSDADCRKVLDNMQIASTLRRQAKNEQQDYKDIQDELIKMKAALKMIERKLNDNMTFRRRSVDSQSTKKSGAQIAIEVYLESIGLNPQEYLRK